MFGLAIGSIVFGILGLVVGDIIGEFATPIKRFLLKQ